MKYLIVFFCVFFIQIANAQTKPDINSTINFRLSFLVFPFTPLLTIEVKTIGNFTLQLESNFLHTHGANLKYFIKDRMVEHYMLTGFAFIGNKLLPQNEKITFLPYTGYGYAYRFGKQKQWTFDNRVGIGATTNADKNSVYPVMKTGIGKIF